MFNALSGLGAGGSMSSNVGLTDAANGALYGCFAVVGFFAGSVTNTLGVNATLTVCVYKINMIHNNSNNDYFFSLSFTITSWGRLVMLFILLHFGYTTVNKYQDLWLQQVPSLAVWPPSFGPPKVPS
jgi:hypothetical protein